MHGEYFLVDDSGDRETIKTIRKRLPQFDIVSSFALISQYKPCIQRKMGVGGEKGGTFIIEAVDPIDGSAFVISSKNKEIFRVLDFVCKKQTYCFQ